MNRRRVLNCYLIPAFFLRGRVEFPTGGDRRRVRRQSATRLSRRKSAAKSRWIRCESGTDS